MNEITEIRYFYTRDSKLAAALLVLGCKPWQGGFIQNVRERSKEDCLMRLELSPQIKRYAVAWGDFERQREANPGKPIDYTAYEAKNPTCLLPYLHAVFVNHMHIIDAIMRQQRILAVPINGQRNSWRLTKETLDG